VFGWFDFLLFQTDEKIYELCKNETTRNLRAVQNRNFITVPFSASTLGVRIGTLAYNLAEAFVAFATGQPLSSVDFSEVSISGQAIGSSGVKVYTKLPVWNGTDLETFCPGGPESNAKVSDVPPVDDLFSNTITVKEIEVKEVKAFPGWGIALIVISLVGAAGAGFFILEMIKKEKKGTPMFAANEHSIN